jgi:hypothetical protein
MAVGFWDAFAVGNTVTASTTISSPGVCAVSLPAVAGKTTYVTGFQVVGTGANSATTVNATLASLIGSVTFTYSIAVPTPNTAAITMLQVQFLYPIPASAANTAITLSVPSFGTGNTSVTANIYGITQ